MQTIRAQYALTSSKQLLKIFDMAIKWINASFISRSNGHNALNAAAYRSNERLYCEKSGQMFDYTRKSDCIYSEILLPESAFNSDLNVANHPYKIRENLWNVVEYSESQHNRRDTAQLALELKIALPKELALSDQIELLERFLKEEYIDCFGVVCDIAIHHKEGNPHAHVMIPMRKLNALNFEKRKLRNLAPQMRQGLYSAICIPDGLNKKWERYQNQYAEDKGYTWRVDEGFEIPTVHEGKRDNAEYQSLHFENILIKESNQKLAIEKPESIINSLGNKHGVFGDREIKKLVFKLTESDQSNQLYDQVIDQIYRSKDLISLGFGEDGRIRYTTKSTFESEVNLAKLANELSGNSRFNVHSKLIDSIIEKKTLTQEQGDALKSISKSGQLSCLVGIAGAGKSYTMNAVRELYESHDVEVYGLALAGKAADGLEKEADITSKTIDSFLMTPDQYLPKKGSVIVVDEAGMIGLDHMSKILNKAKEQDYKLLLVGDPDQLQPIAKGAPFRTIIEMTGFSLLSEVRRQSNEADREATKLLARGQVGQALDHYISDDRVMLSTESEIQTALFKQWQNYSDDLKETLILAYTQDEVSMLNHHARSHLLRTGKLGESCDFNVKVSGKTENKSFAVNERIIFLENNRNIGVKNGQLGFIKSFDEKGNIQVQLDSGQFVLFNPKEYNSFDYGYAVTVHKSQGVTVDNALVYASSKLFNRFLSYVALSRHRHNVHLYADNKAFKDINELKRGLSRSPLRDTVLEYPLNFAMRRGKDAEVLAKNAADKINHFKRVVKDKWNYLFNYDLYQQDITNQNKQVLNREAKKIADLADLHLDAVQSYAQFKNEYGDKWFENSDAKSNYFDLKLDQKFYLRNEAAYQLIDELDKFERALELNNLSVEKVKAWTDDYLAETQINAFKNATNPYLKGRLAQKITDRIEEPFTRKVLTSEQLWQDVKEAQISHTQRAKSGQVEGFAKRSKALENYLTAVKSQSHYWHKTQAEDYNKDQSHFERYERISKQFEIKSEQLAFEIMQEKEAYLPVVAVRLPYEVHQSKCLLELEKRAEKHRLRLMVREYIHEDLSDSKREFLAHQLTENRKACWWIAREEGLIWKTVYRDSYKAQVTLQYEKLSDPYTKKVYREAQKYIEIREEARLAYVEVLELEAKLKKEKAELDKKGIKHDIEVPIPNDDDIKQELFKTIADRNEAAYDLLNKFPEVLDIYIPNLVNFEPVFRQAQLHQERLDAKERVKNYVEGGYSCDATAYEITQRYGKHAFYINNTYEFKPEQKQALWRQARTYELGMNRSRVDEAYYDLYDALVNYELAKFDAGDLWSSIRNEKKLGNDVKHLQEKAYKLSITRNEKAFKAYKELGDPIPAFVRHYFNKLDLEKLKTHHDSYKVIDLMQSFKDADYDQREILAGQLQKQYEYKSIAQALYYTKADKKAFNDALVRFNRRELESRLDENEKVFYQRIREYMHYKSQAGAVWHSYYSNPTNKAAFIRKNALQLSEKRNALAAQIIAFPSVCKELLAFEQIDTQKLAVHAKQYETKLLRDAKEMVEQSETIISDKQTTNKNTDSKYKTVEVLRWDYNRINEALLRDPEATYTRIFGAPPKSRTAYELRFGEGRVVSLKGKFAGCWADFMADSQGTVGGSPIKAIQYFGSARSFNEVLEEAARIANLSEDEAKYMDHRVVNDRYQKQKEARLAKEELLRKQSIESAQSIWDQSIPVKFNDHTDQYMARHRNVYDIGHTELRTLPVGAKWIDFNDRGERIAKENRSPAMIIAVRDKNDQITGVQRTYLDQKTANKNTFFTNPKLSKGVIKGGAGELQIGLKHGRVYIAEGIETGASVGLADKDATVLTSLSIGNLSSMIDAVKTYHPKEVILLKDNDGINSNTEKTFNQAVKAYQEAGLNVTVKEPLMSEKIKLEKGDKAKTDWNDVIQEKGLNGLKEEIGLPVQTEYPKNFIKAVENWKKVSLTKEQQEKPDYKAVHQYTISRVHALKCLTFLHYMDEKNITTAEMNKRMFALIDSFREAAVKLEERPQYHKAARDLGLYDLIKEDARKHRDSIEEREAMQEVINDPANRDLVRRAKLELEARDNRAAKQTKKGQFKM